MKGVHQQQKNLVQVMLSKRVSSSATWHCATQGSITHQPTPMDDWCSSSPYSFKNYVRTEKHQHRSTLEVKKACTETQTGPKEPRSNAREGPSLAKHLHLLPPLNCLQLLRRFKFSTDPTAEPVPVYLRHVSWAPSATIASAGPGAGQQREGWFSTDTRAGCSCTPSCAAPGNWHIASLELVTCLRCFVYLNLLHFCFLLLVYFDFKTWYVGMSRLGSRSCWSQLQAGLTRIWFAQMLQSKTHLWNIAIRKIFVFQQSKKFESLF